MQTLLKRSWIVWIVCMLVIQALGVTTITAQAAAAWQSVGSAEFSAGTIGQIDLAMDQATPYVAFEDYANGNKVSVMKYDGNDWVYVGTPGFSAGTPMLTNLSIDNGTAYVQYLDINNNGKASVLQFDGDNWVYVGPAGFTEESVYDVSFTVYEGTPYIAYAAHPNMGTAQVMKFDGASWVNVGTPGFSGGQVDQLSLVVDAGTPYLAYRDYANDAKVTVKTFDGENWVPVGNPAFSDGDVYNISLAVANGTPYVAYRDFIRDSKVTVEKFDGDSWINVGTPGFSASHISSASLVIENNTPFVAYSDFSGNSGKATVMKFDGSTWEPVDTQRFTAKRADTISLLAVDGTLYIGYRNTNVDGLGFPTDGKASVMKYITELAPQPVVSIDPNSYDFGDVTVSQTGTGQVFTLTNTGTENLVIETLTASESFSKTTDTCSDQTIAPAADCTFTIAFVPAAAGVAAGSVSIPSNAVSSPDSVSLNGNGVLLPAPGSFSKESPLNQETGVSLTPAFTWGTSSDAASYQYCIGSSSGVCDVLDWTPAESGVTLEVSLSPDTTYFWQVAATNHSGTAYANASEEPEWWSFTTGSIETDTTPPSASIDSSPLGVTNSTAAIFEFSATDDHSAPEMLTFWCDLDGLGWEDCSGGERSYSNLSEAPHTFSLNVVDEAGNELAPDYLTYSWLIDQTAPTVSAIIRAGNNPTSAVTVDFTVTFAEAVTGVNAADFKLVASGLKGVSISKVKGSGDEYTVTATTGSGSGTLRLDLIDNGSILDLAGNPLEGDFELGEEYSILKSVPSPSLPVLLTPAPNALLDTLQPTLDWKDSTPAAHHYQLQVATNSTFTSLIINKTDLTESTYPFAELLTPGKLYYWRVKALNMVNGSNGWSAVRTFKTSLDPATLIAPGNTDSLLTNQTTFDWDPVEGASRYMLQVSTSDSFRSLLVNTTVTDSAYAMTKNLPRNKIIYWRVRAKTPVVNSAWSEVWSFQTGNPPTVPVLVAPVSNALLKDYTPVLNWKDAAVPTSTTFKHYEIEVDDDKDFSSTVISMTTSLSEFTPEDVNPFDSNTKYYWRVRAVNTVEADDHVSAWSPVWSFRTVVEAPDSLTVSATGNPARPHFDWSEPSGTITSYTIQISTSPTFGTFIINTTTKDSLYTILRNLPTGRIIYWRVRANGANGPSAWSKAQFTLPLP